MVAWTCLNVTLYEHCLSVCLCSSENILRLSLFIAYQNWYVATKINYDSGLLERDAVQLGEQIPKFQRPFMGWSIPKRTANTRKSPLYRTCYWLTHGWCGWWTSWGSCGRDLGVMMWPWKGMLSDHVWWSWWVQFRQSSEWDQVMTKYENDTETWGTAKGWDWL